MLSVALTSQALTLTASLLDDLAVERCDLQTDLSQTANFDDLTSTFTATQRVALVLNSVPLVQLLFNLAMISYRKSCNLKSGLNTKSHEKKRKRKRKMTIGKKGRFKKRRGKGKEN